MAEMGRCQAARKREGMHGMLEQLPAAAAAMPGLARRGRYVTLEVLVGVGEEDFIVSIERGAVAGVRRRRLAIESGVFAVRAAAEVWAEHWRPLPRRDHHDLFSMLSSGLARIDGDLKPFMQNLLYFKDLLAAPRVLTRAEGGR